MALEPTKSIGPFREVLTSDSGEKIPHSPELQPLTSKDQEHICCKHLRKDPSYSRHFQKGLKSVEPCPWEISVTFIQRLKIKIKSHGCGPRQDCDAIYLCLVRMRRPVLGGP